MKILVTNDDGFQSPFLKILCDALKVDHEVFLTVPEKEQSGIGQAISIYNSLTYIPIPHMDFTAYKISGTPSDCVKFAVCHLFKEEKFDLVVSGINPGENAGLSALYSGTVAGAREGATWGIPSIALSVWNKNPVHAEAAALWLNKSLKNKNWFEQPFGVFWNINFPDCVPQKIRGVKICSMSMAMFKDHYQEFVTPRGSSEYWLDGVKPIEKYVEETDDKNLMDKYIAITPLQIDQSSPSEIERLHQLQPEFSI